MLARLATLLVLCVTAFAAGASHAATLPVPTVEYSADRTVETDAGTMTGKVYVAKGKERQETSMKGFQSVTILRQDKQLGYMLMPAQHMYQQLDITAARKQSGSQDAAQVDITEVGKETLDGHATTKYKLLMKDGSAGGFIWITAEGIPMKMDMLSKSGGNKTRMTVTLANLQIGTQDPQLFEVPGDYKALPNMGGLGALSGMGGGTRNPFGR
jgi:outer membrane lipoprotein-sorting protein